MKPVDALAIFGGQPAFATPLHIAQLNLPDWHRVEQKFREIFQRRYYANNGPLVRALDEALAERLSVAHAVSVTNGTVALMILARALELAGEVIVPAFTFPATAQAVAWAGLTPVLCDVSPATHMLTPATVAAAASEKTAGILGVHLWGRACDPDALQAFATERGYALFFDACHAIGCSHDGRSIGGFGDGEAFSFHATKVLNGAEGGCVTTNDARLADRLRTIRNFHSGETFANVDTRMNGKMSEAQAALALLSLDDLADNVAANREQYRLYENGLRDIDGLSLAHHSNEASNCQYVVVEVDAARFGLHRDTVFKLLMAENVLCRRHFFPGLHRTAPFDDGVSVRLGHFPATDRLCDSVLQLPIGQTVVADDIRLICDILRGIARHAGDIARRLGNRQ